MSWMQCILYAFICGIAEFLPISAPAHGIALQHLFGAGSISALFMFFVHSGMLVAVIFTSKDQLHRLRLHRNLQQRSSRKRNNFTDPLAKTESGLLKTGSLVLLISCLFYKPVQTWSSSLNISAVFLLINGVLLFVLAHLPRYHKDPRSMTPLDGFLMGLSGWLSTLSGISRIGITTTVASLRGASMSNAYKWSLLISIPALVGLMILDVVTMFTGGLVFNFTLLVQSLIGAFFGFIGAFLSINAMRAYLQRGEFSGFAFYCWGAALFSFILFLI